MAETKKRITTTQGVNGVKYPLTAQQILDGAAKHLRKQRAKSVDDYGVCKYRGPNGTMCALGPFLSDRDAPKFEGYTARDIATFNYANHGVQIFADDDAEDVADAVQSAHDGADKEDPKFKKRLMDVASDFGLEWKNGR